MANLTDILGNEVVHLIVYWTINALMATIVGGWVYALYKTVRRVTDEVRPDKETPPSLERIPETNVIAVHTSWLESHSVFVTVLVAMTIVWMFMGRLQILGLFGFFAPSIISLITILLIWINYHIGKLQLTDKRAIRYGGLFGEAPTAIMVKEIETIIVEFHTWWERKFQLPTIRIVGGDPQKEIEIPKVSEAKRFEAILMVLKKKAELGLPMHAPLPPDAAREEFKDWSA